MIPRGGRDLLVAVALLGASLSTPAAPAGAAQLIAADAKAARLDAIQTLKTRLNAAILGVNDAQVQPAAAFDAARERILTCTTLANAVTGGQWRLRNSQALRNLICDLKDPNLPPNPQVDPAVLTSVASKLSGLAGDLEPANVLANEDHQQNALAKVHDAYTAAMGVLVSFERATLALVAVGVSPSAPGSTAGPQSPSSSQLFVPAGPTQPSGGAAVPFVEGSPGQILPVPPSLLGVSSSPGSPAPVICRWNIPATLPPSFSDPPLAPYGPALTQAQLPFIPLPPPLPLRGPAAPLTGSGATSVLVRKGDTLSGIAQELAARMEAAGRTPPPIYGAGGLVEKIARANHIRNQDLIYAGSSLQLPQDARAD